MAEWECDIQKQITDYTDLQIKKNLRKRRFFNNRDMNKFLLTY
jgi:hypothetical protein